MLVLMSMLMSHTSLHFFVLSFVLALSYVASCVLILMSPVRIRINLVSVITICLDRNLYYQHLSTLCSILSVGGTATGVESFPSPISKLKIIIYYEDVIANYTKYFFTC